MKLFKQHRHLLLTLSAMAFSTQAYAAGDVTLLQTAVDLNGGNIEIGDTLEYQIIVTNNGGSAVTNPRITHLVPPGTTYQNGTLTVNSVSEDDIYLQNTSFPEVDYTSAQLNAGASLSVK